MTESTKSTGSNPISRIAMLAMGGVALWFIWPNTTEEMPQNRPTIAGKKDRKKQWKPNPNSQPLESNSPSQETPEELEDAISKDNVSEPVNEEDPPVDVENEAPVQPNKKARTRRDDHVYATNPQGITGAIRAFKKDIQRCYEQALLDEDLATGRVRFNFTIESQTDDPDNADIAKITEVGVRDSTLDNEQVEDCIMNIIDELWFEPPEDGPVMVQYPFVFMSE